MKSGPIQSPRLAFAIGAALLVAAPAVRADSLYVSTYNQVLEISTGAGSVSVFADGLASPSGLAFDAKGNLYVASYYGNYITKFSPAGVGSVFASTGLNNPQGMAFDQAGNLYVANQGGTGSIERFTPNGVGSVFASPSTGLSFAPSSLAFDSAGNLFSASINGPTIARITPSGAVSSFVNTSQVFGVDALAFDRAGNLYEGSVHENTIFRYSSEGTSLGAFATGAENSLAFDASGNLYASAYSHPGYIEAITPGGGTTVLAAGLTWPSFLAIIPEPSACAVLSLGMAALVALRRRAAC